MEISIKDDIMYRKHSDGTQDVLHVPLPLVTKEKRREVIADAWNKVTGAIQTVYTHAYDEYVTYEITPTPSVRNNQAYILAKVIASFYKSPTERREWGLPWKGGLLREQSQYRMNFRMIMKPNDIAFYLLLPREKAGEILRKAEAVYDSNITIREIEHLPSLDPSRMHCSELKYKKHDIFSLKTDKDDNYPLPSLLATVRTLEGDDIAVFDAMIEPYSHMDWHKEAKDAHNLLDRGFIPNSSTSGKFLRIINDLFSKARMEILELTRFTPTQKEALKKWKNEEGQSREVAFIKEHMTKPTKRKQDEEVVKAHLRIAVQSDSPERALGANRTLANAWKDLSADNELERVDVPQKWNDRYWKAIEDRKGFYVSFKPPKLSVDEAGKFLQMPGKELIEEFPQVRHQSVKEIALPDELNRLDIKTMRIGYVTERGQKKLARVPLEAYTLKVESGDDIKIKLKEVYDAVCTASFAQGKQGSGKSEGFGSVMAYDMIMAGFTAIIIDTADGQMLRDLVDSLPKDYPEEKIHALNLDNKAFPIPLDWSDVYGRKFVAADGDDELQALEISERLTQRFIGYIDSLKRTNEEFSDRMRQYVNSSMRAITTTTNWSFLNLELALTSPSYREELLQREEVQNQPDVVRDLESLQDRAAEGKDRVITDPIVTRLKELSNTQFMTNLFYQDPKLHPDGSPVLDLRKIMDNPEGGYGHIVVIQASFDAWQESQATLLGFVEDKINFNAFSRIDINQSERKPVLKWIDEPHKVIKAIEDRLAGTSVEFRKYRVKNLFTGHSIVQMGKAVDALMDGGAQITSYKTESLKELKRFEHSFKPYDDAKALYDALPDKHVAINKVRLPSGKDCPAFIAKMVKPPSKVKDRSYVWDDCAKKYGRPWKEVRDNIQEKRVKYQLMDEDWMKEKKAEKNKAKEKTKKKES